MESLTRHQEVGPGMSQDQVVFPTHQVGQQYVVLLLLGNGRMHAEKGLWVRPYWYVLREVVGLLFGVAPDEGRILLHLV